MDGSVLVVLAVYQSNLVSSENDDVTSGSMNTTLAAIVIVAIIWKRTFYAFMRNWYVFTKLVCIM